MRCARFARAAESDVATARRKRLSQHQCTNAGQNIGHKQASHVEVFSLWCKNDYSYILCTSNVSNWEVCSPITLLLAGHSAYR